jgi:oligoribonuclease
VADKDKRLIWIDLEMTGLNFETDTILEIATIITDSQLNIIAQGPTLAIHQPDDVLAAMDKWCTHQHAKTGLTQQVKDSTTTMSEAEEQTLAFVREHCKEKKAPLCGNSIWVDRVFMQYHMPTLSAFFHYKNIDVTSIKELVKDWYPNNPATDFKKSENHRALEDIVASIEELKHYRKNFFIP